PVCRALTGGLGAGAGAPKPHRPRRKSDTPRRAGGLMSRAASKAAGCHLPTQTASNRPASSLVFWSRIYSGLTKSRGFAWPQVLCPSPVGIFLVVSRCDAFERKCDKSLGVEVQIVRQPARRADGLAIPWPDGLRFADSRNRL